MVKAKIFRDLMTQLPLDYPLPGGDLLKIGRAEECPIRILPDAKDIEYDSKKVYYANAVSKNAGTIFQDKDRSVRLYREIGTKRIGKPFKESSKIYIIPKDDIIEIRTVLDSIDSVVDELLNKMETREDVTNEEHGIRELRYPLSEFLLYPGKSQNISDGSLVIFGINYQFLLLAGETIDLDARQGRTNKFRIRDTQGIVPSDTSLRGLTVR